MKQSNAERIFKFDEQVTIVKCERYREHIVDKYTRQAEHKIFHIA